MKHLSDIIGLLIAVYVFGVLFSFIAFDSIEHKKYDTGSSADAFLKAIVWPHSVIEHNRKH